MHGALVAIGWRWVHELGACKFPKTRRHPRESGELRLRWRSLQENRGSRFRGNDPVGGSPLQLKAYEPSWDDTERVAHMVPAHHEISWLLAIRPELWTPLAIDNVDYL